MPHGICHGIQFCLVYIIAADGQGDCSGRFRIDNGTQTALLAEHNQVGVRLGYDGNTAVVVHDLNQNTHAASLEETVISEFLFRGISGKELPQTIPDNPDRLAEQAFGLDAFQGIPGAALSGRRPAPPALSNMTDIFSASCKGIDFFRIFTGNCNSYNERELFYEKINLYFCFLRYGFICSGVRSERQRVQVLHR